MVPHPNRNKKKRPVATATAAPRRAKPRPAAPRHDHEVDYANLLASVSWQFAQSGSHLFCTDATFLNDTYLRHLPGERQIHDCSACRRFIETYGGLVYIMSDGEQIPVMWRSAGVAPFYRDSVDALDARVRRANVTSVFLTKEKTWGLPTTGPWTHLSVRPPARFVYDGLVLTAGQAMAAAIENVKTVQTALGEFRPEHLDEALRVFESERVDRSEKFVGPVRWLRQLHDRPKGKLGHNLLWAAVAAAPEGYCHPRASVIGPFLEGIAAGEPFAVLKGKFEAMLHPLRYQRPQAAPAAGNIKAAEAVVAKLGIERSLERRFARLDELETIWKPPHILAAPTKGVFGHLMPTAPTGINLPRQNITWEKFQRVVLPAAERIETVLGYKAPLVAFTTAEHADAPLIFKWENPVAWYLYHGNSRPEDWGIQSNTWLPLTAIAPLPTMWGPHPQPHLHEGVVLVIRDCADKNRGHNGLFPDNLKADLHGVRATIEAYSKSALLGGRESASACGFDLRKGFKGPVPVRVFASNAWAEYAIDRWD